MTSKIVLFDRPRHFRDSMIRGAFARFDHDHTFEPHAGGTRMTDDFDFTAPLGVLGTIVDTLVLHRYLTEIF